MGITNGLLSRSLDFGSVFDGTARWLQIGVRTNGSANFTALSPRQPVAAVPYSMFSGSATNVVGALSAANLAPVTSMITISSNGLYSALQSSFTTNLAISPVAGWSRTRCSPIGIRAEPAGRNPAHPDSRIYHLVRDRQVLFTKLKSIGMWTNRLDVLYPMVPAQPYLNAFATNTIVPVGTVITNSMGIAGNGTSSYFTNGYHFVTNATHLSLNSASVGVYNGTASPSGFILIGNFDGTNQIALINSPGAVYANINDITASGGLFSSSCAGLLIASRISASQSYIYGRAGLVNRGLPAVSLPNAYCYLAAETRGFECNAQLRGAWIGGGITTSEMAQLNGIWEEYESILGRQAP